MKYAIIALIFTFVGSYGTFKAYKMKNASLSDVKYYHMVVKYKREKPPNPTPQEAWIESAVEASTKVDIEDVKPKVFIGTAISLFLSLGIALLVFRQDQKKKNVKVPANGEFEGDEFEDLDLVDELGRIKCPACGHVNPPGVEYCNDCGLRLNWDT